MIQKLREALRDARKAFLRPVSWRVSPEAEVELRAMATGSDPTITQNNLMGLPFEVDRTLNGSLVELVTDPPAHASLQELDDLLATATPMVTYGQSEGVGIFGRDGHFVRHGEPVPYEDHKVAEAMRDAVERRP